MEYWLLLMIYGDYRGFLMSINMREEVKMKGVEKLPFMILSMQKFLISSVSLANNRLTVNYFRLIKDTWITGMILLNALLIVR